MPYPEVLDPLPDRKNWSEFKALWDSRQDVEKAVQALRIAEDWARDAPDNGDVQVWAARVCYSIGEYWTSMGKHDENAVPFYKKGIPYGEKAVKMMPHSVPAKYWYNACLGRSVQTASLMKKASLMTKFMDLVLFFFRENPQYNFFGYNITLSPMITNGGWVTEKAMRLAGVTVEGEMASLDMACIIYPDYLSLPYSKALLLAYKGKKNEAIRILEAMMAKNPDISTSITAENRNNLRLARILYNELKKEK
jgi:tetratricopeptide (TPR) repeat protein